MFKKQPKQKMNVFVQKMQHYKYIFWTLALFLKKRTHFVIAILNPILRGSFGLIGVIFFPGTTINMF